ncbi:signal transduction histidine kinase [Thermocatellispora tengchongensis]|uniref:histidine kinase n=1 Tax=Thermocatellispora tengchongensis TaxID=1073253 RepID=A0A840PPA7_9ACTN|nr:sensor histidine kinase [Thermocatellispora tengchongensis]MBB5139611.1 signal transduction histidine kinase [Thermocatellispora tengchongensis]
MRDATAGRPPGRGTAADDTTPDLITPPRPLLARRLTWRELVALDAAGAVAYTLALLATIRAAPGLPDWATPLIVAALGPPLAVRRLWPRPVFAVVLAASGVALWHGLIGDPLIAAAFALYAVALDAPRRRREPTLLIGAVSLGIVLVGSVGVGTRAPGPPEAPVPQGPAVALLGLAVLGGTWTVGRAVRERRAYAARAAEQLAYRAVTEERLRIARELHDVVSHTLSLIGVKAAIANHVADSRPEEVRDALRVIETTSREALTEMRHMLGILRAGATAPAAGPEPELGPQPGLAGLAELAERAAQAGVRVEMDVRGAAGLPEGVELTVYRIVQEAVTNVVRHAAPARCHVLIDGGEEGMTIVVRDDGPGERRLPAAPPGHGLIGMRERVAMYGGSFAAGPHPEGGFQVTATLPRDAVAPAR